MSDENKKKFVVDPVVASWASVILYEMFKAAIGFFTMQTLRAWWHRKDKNVSNPDPGVPQEEPKS